MFEINLYGAREFGRGEWRGLQGLSRIAFSRGLRNRSREEIDALVGWNEPDRYYESHIDPNSEVGRRFNSSQIYFNPKVAVATEDGEPIGFIYSANNVSGRHKAEIATKRLFVAKRYLWLREVVVRPDKQGRGIAKAMGRTLLKAADEDQPVSTYVWPEEIPHIQEKLAGLGFAPTGDSPVKPFGPSGDTVRQVRMQAPNVRTVLSRLPNQN